MKFTHIDFAPRTLRRTWALHSGRIGLFAGIGLLLWAYIAIQAFQLSREYRDSESEIARLDARIAKRAAQQASSKPWMIPAAQLVSITRAIEQLNLPWRDVLNAIERATPSTIAVLSLEPDARKHSIRCLAEAKTRDAMLAYIEQMKQQSFVKEVILIRHEINEKDPNKPVRFTFEAHWAGVAQ